MPSNTDKSDITAARIAAYEQYRDTLIQILFVSKARQYLAEIEDLERIPDPTVRKPFEDRRKRLAHRQAVLGAALTNLMNNPLIDHRHAQNRGGPAYSTTYGAAGGHGFTAVDDEADWIPPPLPTTNINGLPMVGGVDVQGNPYGSTFFDNNGF